MTRYALGFVFSPLLDKVLLIHKLKPAWQVGKVNGLGGKIESGEDGAGCVVREVAEEAALQTTQETWTFIGTFGASLWMVEVFGCVYAGDLCDARSLEEERVEWFSVDHLPTNIVPNLSWLVPITLDKLKHGEIRTFKVENFC